MTSSPCLETIFTPDLSAAAFDASLRRLLRRGNLLDQRMIRYCAGLDARFSSFVSTCPAPWWAPGLFLTGWMRNQYEIYLPMDEIRLAFAYLCRIACLYEVNINAAPAFSALSWPDFLARIQPVPDVVNPAAFIRKLADCDSFRHAFLAAVFIPKSYGGCFDRYPLQKNFLRRWLAARRENFAASVMLLDAACGCGEGTYEMAGLLLEEGYSIGSSRVHGSTFEPLELVAAAHGRFPHDPLRARAFQDRVHSLLAEGAVGGIRFFYEDICHPADPGERYDVILCNGLLGGPLLHRREQLAMAVRSLVARLNPGGILLVADNFHHGWKKREQGETLSLLRENLLDVVDAGEGVAGVKSVSAGRPRRVRRRNP